MRKGQSCLIPHPSSLVPWRQHLPQAREFFLTPKEARQLERQVTGVAGFSVQGWELPLRHVRVFDLEQSLRHRDVAQAIHPQIAQPHSGLEIAPEYRRG